MGLRAHVHREDVRKDGGVVEPAARDLRGQRTRCPCVHDVGVADETTGLAALRLCVSRGDVGTGVDGQLVFGGNERVVVVDRLVGEHGIPQRNRDTEVTLTTDEPVAVQTLDPVLVTVAHVVGMPREFVSASHETGTQVGLASTVADVPLARGDDFERAFTLFEELHRVSDGPRFTQHLAACTQLFDDGGLGLLDVLARDGRIVVATALRRDGIGRLGDDASVASDDRARRKVQFAPPRDVGRVAERTDHGDTGALVGLGERVGDDWNFDVEEWCANRRAEEWLVALVVGVCDECDARSQQFGTRGVDEDVAGTVGLVEGERVVRTGSVAILEFGLCDGGVEVDVPQSGRFL